MPPAMKPVRLKKKKVDTQMNKNATLFMDRLRCCSSSSKAGATSMQIKKSWWKSKGDAIRVSAIAIAISNATAFPPDFDQMMRENTQAMKPITSAAIVASGGALFAARGRK